MCIQLLVCPVHWRVMTKDDVADVYRCPVEPCEVHCDAAALRHLHD